jgi:hypothetical protein
MGWIAFSLIVGAVGIGFLVNFRDLPRHSYDRAVRFWDKTPVIGLDYRRIMPFAVYRYGIGIWFCGFAVAGLVAAALTV